MEGRIHHMKDSLAEAVSSGSRAEPIESSHALPEEPIDAKAILEATVEFAAEAKGKDILALDVSTLSDLAKYFVIVSGRSDRQVQGLCNRIIEGLEERGATPNAIEGLDKGHWVVLDFDEVIVHVFYEPMRAHYDIESLWAKASRLEKIAGARSAAA